MHFRHISAFDWGALGYALAPTHFAVTQNRRKPSFFLGGGANKICPNIYHSPKYDRFSW